jgi:hypothetical protein
VVHPAREPLHDLVTEVDVPVRLPCSTDRLARKFAQQVLLAEEFVRAGRTYYRTSRRTQSRKRTWN